MAKNWCLTGWLDKGAEDLSAIWAASKSLAYLAGQKEKCPKTGRLHWQAWVQFNKRVRLTGAVKVFPSGTWSLSVVKDVPRMKAYVRKNDETTIEGTWCEFGEHSEKGKATAWQDLADSVIAGTATKRSLWQEHHGAMSTRFRAAYEMMSVLGTVETTAEHELKSFEWDPITDWSKSIVLHGESQIGKTQFGLFWSAM